MADALRHARLLHYLLIALSLGSLAMFMQRNPLAETYAAAQLELKVLRALVGYPTDEAIETTPETSSERMEQARNLITARVQEHVHQVLSRSLQLGMGGDFDEIHTTWEVPIAHQAQLPLDSDLLEIRSYFAAIPILVLQPDLGELAWILTSGMTPEEAGAIRELKIVVNDLPALEEHVRRHGFSDGEDSINTKIQLDYRDASGAERRIESSVRAQAVRVPDLNQRTAFHASFGELERIFHFVEFQTPEQARITLAEREREARGWFGALCLSLPLRIAVLLGIPLFMILMLSHVRHLVELLPDSDLRPIRYFAWFPLFPDPNSRTLGIISLMLLPGAGALAWVVTHFVERSPLPLDDLLLYAASFLVPVWIGSSILTELDAVKNAAAEAIGDPELDEPISDS